jgi:hypothetical protein
MTTIEIFQYVKGHPSGKVKIAVTDIDGILRGKYISNRKIFFQCWMEGLVSVMWSLAGT